MITFHSLDDKIVKDWENNVRKGLFINRYRPLVSKNYPSLIPINKKPIVAAIDELDRNKRARSAKLRVYKKVSDNPSKFRQI